MSETLRISESVGRCPSCLLVLMKTDQTEQGFKCPRCEVTSAAPALVKIKHGITRDKEALKEAKIHAFRR